MIRSVLSIAIAVSISNAALASENTADQPTNADVIALERTVHLPKGARSLRAYARYYALSHEDGRSILVGTYLLDAPDAPGRYLRATPVEVLDGGCSVVTVRFDLTARRVVGAFCNGVA
jgi:hypothetical protein